jgi:hypothetical protein
MAETKKGNLSIHTENIFPIIKKWLYSEHDIFLRELISNAVDAMSKRKLVDSNVNPEDLKIEIKIDKNSSRSINLNEFFADEDKDSLYYSYYKTKDLSVNINLNIATIIPDKELGFQTSSLFLYSVVAKPLPGCKFILKY